MKWCENYVLTAAAALFQGVEWGKHTYCLDSATDFVLHDCVRKLATPSRFDLRRASTRGPLWNFRRGACLEMETPQHGPEVGQAAPASCCKLIRLHVGAACPSRCGRIIEAGFCRATWLLQTAWFMHRPTWGCKPDKACGKPLGLWASTALARRQPTAAGRLLREHLFPRERPREGEPSTAVVLRGERDTPSSPILCCGGVSASGVMCDVCACV